MQLGMAHLNEVIRSQTMRMRETSGNPLRQGLHCTHGKRLKEQGPELSVETWGWTLIMTFGGSLVLPQNPGQLDSDGGYHPWDTSTSLFSAFSLSSCTPAPKSMSLNRPGGSYLWIQLCRNTLPDSDCWQSGRANTSSWEGCCLVTKLCPTFFCPHGL